MKKNAQHSTQPASSDANARSAAEAFAHTLAEKFSVALPLSLLPPNPAAFGYHRFVLRLTREEGNTDGLKIPQPFFMQIYELCLRNVGAIPTGTALHLEFEPCIPDKSCHE